ncbi:AMP-dependent synthetase/ligase [Capillimicrobium parvum]|uniref:Acyl-CoA synthetase n=1 Tax=Capillimicrobium parvum TaxID=2884022 RepID=A0A9E7C324_9ACTN|nr:AMP-dependent synthetase/ligase [Capillimicrobium parvum]UGS38202.1 Long-chain-fatty-acid--CoA ligase FadD15 [Capillimicrobium parvum]
MEATASTASTPERTGSKTIADLLPRAAELFGARTAVRYRDGDKWRDRSFAELGAIAQEIGLGLVDLGIAAGDRVCILAKTRAEWSYVDFGITMAGGIVVPIYQTNSPEECEWVIGNSEAVAIFCEDPEQLAKVAEIRDRLALLRHVVVMEGAAEGDAITLDELRERGRRHERAELEARWNAVGPDDPYTIIYTSGTTGPPKGCVLAHGNYRAIVDMVAERELFRGPDDLVYLFLPLAHSFALLIQLAAFDQGTAIAYWGGDTKQIVAELSQAKPTYLPSVPRIFEKIYTLVSANVEPEMLAQAVAVGGRVQDLRVAGQDVPAELQAAYDQFDAKLFANVRAAFGGRLREAITGAAPIAKEILEFFWACGVPVMEGYGMTETATAATVSTPENHKFGTVGRALPGVELAIGDDGEVLIRGANIFRGYYRNEDASFGAVVDGWLHTGDLGSLDADGYLSITGRKKDIIITAGGKNLTPANMENDLKQSRWISQAVMHGDRRPFPSMLITLDEEEIVPWAQQHDIEDTSMAALARDPLVLELIQGELDRANARYAQVEQVKRFFILDHDLSQETGELTPTLKVKRNVVNEMYAGRFDELYAGR